MGSDGTGGAGNSGVPLSATDLAVFDGSLLGRGIDLDDLRQLIDGGWLGYVEWAAGRTIARRGAAQTDFFVVLMGRLEVTRTRSDGARHIIDIVTAGIACGAVTAFGDRPRWPADVEAVEPVHALVVKTPALLDPRSADPLRQLVLQGCVRLLAERARHLNARSELLSRRGLRARLAFFLVHHADESDRVDPALTRQELADTLQVSRASMTRELGRMADERLIAIHHRVFQILDSGALHRIAE